MIQINSKLFPHTADAYVVGGTIRDLLCDRPPVDYDIVVLQAPEQFASELAHRLAGHVVEIGKPGLSIMRVIAEQATYDISAAQGLTIEEDLHRRDFTINAMALHLATGDLIDCMDSRRDLAQKKIRMVQNDVFSKDPVRLIRAYRLAACLDFTIEHLTAAAIGNSVGLISKSAGERIREELLRLLNSANSSGCLRQMAANGLLNAFIHEWSDLNPGNQKNHDDNDIGNHALRTCFQLEALLGRIDRWVVPQYAHAFRRHMQNNQALLKFAIMLDAITGPVAAFKQEGNVNVSHNAQKSATLARAVCKRLRFSKRETDYVDFIVRNQLYPYYLFIARQKNRLSPRALSRFFRTGLDRTPDLLLHAVAAFNDRSRTALKNEHNFRSFAADLLKTYYADFVPRAARPPLITGHDLMSEFNLTPSPLFKKILARVEEERLARSRMSKGEALTLIEKYLKKRSSHE